MNSVPATSSGDEIEHHREPPPPIQDKTDEVACNTFLQSSQSQARFHMVVQLAIAAVPVIAMIALYKLFSQT